MARPVVVAFGDSVTLGARPGVAEEATFRARAAAALARAGRPVTMINAGVGGSSTAHGLARMETDVLAHRPDVVVLMFGLNDACLIAPGGALLDGPRLSVAEYRANLGSMLDRLEEVGCRALLCTPNPMTPKYPYAAVGGYAGRPINAVLEEFVAACRSLAAERGVPLVDVYTAFVDTPGALDLVEDGCHPYAAGHALIADLLDKPLRRLVDESGHR